MHLKYLDKCPVCSNERLSPVINLGNLYSQGSFITKTTTYAPKRKIPNILVRCNTELTEGACGAVFSKVVVPPEILYANYHYHSSTSQSMKDWLSFIAKEAQSIVSKANSVLDIGANDLTSLKQYPSNWYRLGVDPSDIALNAQKENPDINLINKTFPEGMDDWSLSQKFHIISSIACYYDIEKPVEFAKAVKHLLTHDGIWVFEVAYLPTMMKDLVYGQIVPEHLFHYTFTVLETIMTKAGLKIFRAQKTDTNSGSLLCFASRRTATYEKPEWKEEITNLRREEFDLELDTDKPYKLFAQQITNHLLRFKDEIKRIFDKGHDIYLYGVSTKINTLIQASDTGRYFKAGIERSPSKVGGKTLWGLDIISEEKARMNANNRTVWVVGPYHFMSEILEREQEAVKRGVIIWNPANC